MMELVYLTGGLLDLWLGTELVVRSAQTIAAYYKLSEMFIGITVVAIGTDLPEIVLSITASFEKLGGTETSGVIIGNVLGSNFANLGLVLGLIGYVSYLTLTKAELYRDGTMLLGSMLLFALISWDGRISRVEGIIFIIIYLIYYISLIREEKMFEKVRQVPRKYHTFSILAFIGGLLIVIYFSNIVVENAVLIAKMWELPQTFVGIIIIGFGTSLPEFAISLNAIIKKSAGLSVGNIIGSNIFNFFIPIGIGGSIAQLNLDRDLLIYDLPILFGLSLLALIFFYKKRGLQRHEATVLIVIYVLYLLFKFYFK